MRKFLQTYEKILHYVVALVLAVLVTFVKLDFAVIGLETPFLLYIFVVIVSAYIGGFGPGMLALLATSFSVVYFFLIPIDSFHVSSGIIQFQLVVYIFEGLITVIILGALRTLRIQLAEANKFLEERVHNRTKELRTTMNEMSALNEKLKRSNRELEEFAYIASHDLQEPLRKIQAFGNLLAEEYENKLNDEGKLYLEKIQNAASRMRRLIDDLLSYSRVTTHQSEFSIVSLSNIMTDIISNLDVQIQEAAAKISVKKLPEIHGDENQLYQLFQNLISNALRYRSKNRKTNITIWSDESNGMHHIYVKDNGIGFDEKYKDRIFNIFERLHSRHQYEGTGIGLAIVKKIVLRHKGLVEVKSKPDHGTTFCISLPITKKRI